MEGGKSEAENNNNNDDDVVIVTEFKSIRKKSNKQEATVTEMFMPHPDELPSTSTQTYYDAYDYAGLTVTLNGRNQQYEESIDTNYSHDHGNLESTQNKRKANKDVPRKSKRRKPQNDVSVKSDYEKLLELAGSLVPNSELFTCPSCYKEVGVGEGVVLHECLHSYCRQCLISQVENSQAAIVKCPYVNEDYPCVGVLQDMEIKLLVTPELYESHLHRSLEIAESSAENSFHCKTTDCPGWCLFEQEAKEFFCVICQHVNCLSCHLIHEGKTCQEHWDAVTLQMKQNVKNFSCQFEAPGVSTGIKVQRILKCKSEGCAGHCLCDKDVRSFECELCNRVNCVFCAATHEGQSCEEYLSLSKSLSVRKQDESGQIEKDYKMLIELAAVLVPNAVPFSCPICFDDIAKDDGIVLHECLHSFCRSCLISTIQHSETPTVRCPFMNEIYKCESNLLEMEIKSLAPPELYEKHMQRSITIAEGCEENSFHCKTPNCPGWCIYADDMRYFRCDTCGHTSCRTCDVIHEGRTCKQYQELKKDGLLNITDDRQQYLTQAHIDKLIQKGKAMPCPKCKVVLWKVDGCDAIVCSICRTEVCWATKGPRWGPKGAGDISGGCRCGVRGKKCHPKCQNCH